MTAQPVTRPTAGSPTTRTADAGPVARTTRPSLSRTQHGRVASATQCSLDFVLN